MPYLVCGRCRMKTYSAALWSSIDECPACGRDLRRSRRSDGPSEVVPLTAHARFSRAVATPPQHRQPLVADDESA